MNTVIALGCICTSGSSNKINELGNYTEQQQQVCYLMRIGLSNPQIQNMTNLSRPTVWR